MVLLCLRTIPGGKGEALRDDLEKVGHCEGCGEIVFQELHGGHTRAEPDKDGSPVPVQCGPVHLIRDVEDEARARVAALEKCVQAADRMRVAYDSLLSLAGIPPTVLTPARDDYDAARAEVDR